MHLSHKFYRLPIFVDYKQLAEEISSVDCAQWINHPNRFSGNSALPLVSVNGQDNHDVEGAMMLCARTHTMPYLKAVLANLNTSIGRCRLMRLAAGASVPRHCDTNLYWRKRVRIHIPIVTNETVLFESGGQIQHLACGEAWVVDTWHNHSVINRGGERIHLVVDTLGSEEFWRELRTRAWRPSVHDVAPPKSFLDSVVQVEALQSHSELDFVFEESKTAAVLDPVDVEEIIVGYVADIDHRADVDDRIKIEAVLRGLIKNWFTVWQSHGVAAEHHPRFRLVVLHAIQQLDSCKTTARLGVNGQPINTLLEQLIVNLKLPNVVKKATGSSLREIRSSGENTELHPTRMLRSFAPVFIVAAPRSGSTLLYETLGLHEKLIHYNSESHALFETIPSLTVDANGSNALREEHATEPVVRKLKQLFLKRLTDHTQANDFENQNEFLFLEKTPKNALRVDFLKVAFPNARFIYLFRKPEHNISSIIDGWKSRRFITYRQLSGWDSVYDWSFLLPEGWQGLPRDDLGRIATYQYHAANQSIIDSLGDLQGTSSMALSYDEFVLNTQGALEQICRFLTLSWSPQFDKELNKSGGLALSKYTLDPPSQTKWLRNKELLKDLLPEMRRYYNEEILVAANAINLAVT